MNIHSRLYLYTVEWGVEYSDQFGQWWDSLDSEEQESVNTKVILLQQKGPSLPRPHSDTIKTSRHPNMKELVVQHKGRPLRILYAFDNNRCAQLLVGGDKTGDGRWYEKNVPIADDLFEEHVARLKAEK